MRCVVFVAYTSISVTTGGRGVPPLHRGFMFSGCQSVCTGGHGGPPLRGGFATQSRSQKRQRIERSRDVHLRSDLVVDNLPPAALATHQTCSNHQPHTHRQNPKLTRNHIHFHKARNHQRNHHRNRNTGHNPRDNRGNHNASLPESTQTGIFPI
jgi:hypothetical protein